MPSGRETVVNRALSGGELKKLILADAQRLVDNEGLLSEHIAFGRVSYILSLKLHVDNPFMPDSTIELPSRKAPSDKIAVEPVLEALESAPLTAPSPAAEVAAMELERAITSPNAERLRNSMPVPVQVRQQDSTTTSESIVYPPGSFPEIGPGEVMIRDASAALKAAWSPVEPLAE